VYKPVKKKHHRIEACVKVIESNQETRNFFLHQAHISHNVPVLMLKFFIKVR